MSQFKSEFLICSLQVAPRPLHGPGSVHTRSDMLGELPNCIAVQFFFLAKGRAEARTSNV